MRVVASYLGFLPVNDPELVCMIVIDEPQVPYMEASSIAGYWVGKILNDLVQYYGILPDTTTKTSTVPDITNMTARDAVYTLEQEGFKAFAVPSEDAAVVVSQYPAGKSVAPSGSIVILYTSMTTFNDDQLYKPQVLVPRLIGKRRQDAFDKLAALGLLLSFDKTQCTGQIDTQSIAEGTSVDPGTVVYVTFPKPIAIGVAGGIHNSNHADAVAGRIALRAAPHAMIRFPRDHERNERISIFSSIHFQ